MLPKTALNVSNMILWYSISGWFEIDHPTPSCRAFVEKQTTSNPLLHHFPVFLPDFHYENGQNWGLLTIFQSIWGPSAPTLGLGRPVPGSPGSWSFGTVGFALGAAAQVSARFRRGRRVSGASSKAREEEKSWDFRRVWGWWWLMGHQPLEVIGHSVTQFSFFRKSWCLAQKKAGNCVGDMILSVLVAIFRPKRGNEMQWVT